MSRTDDDRLDDIANAIAAIHAHLEHGPISVEIVMDAVAMRLLETRVFAQVSAGW